MRAGCPTKATSLSHGRRETSCFPPCRRKRIKAEFGYDDRKGVGACDRVPSGLGTTRERRVGKMRGRSWRNVLFPALRPRSKPGTQCHTSATSLRKQVSKLRVSDPIYGAEHKDVHCRHCAKDGAFGGHPAPNVINLICNKKGI